MKYPCIILTETEGWVTVGFFSCARIEANTSFTFLPAAATVALPEAGMVIVPTFSVATKSASKYTLLAL